MSNYQFEQKSPMIGIDSDGKPVMISDSRLPTLTQILQNQDYEKKIESIVNPIDNTLTVESGENKVVKLTIQTDQNFLISLPESWLDFEVELYTNENQPIKLEANDVDRFSQISGINTEFTKENNKTIVVNGTNVAYAYVPNSNAFFSRIELKDLENQYTLCYVDEPAMVTKIATAAATQEFFEHDGVEACDRMLANVHTFMPDWALHKDFTNTAALADVDFVTPRGKAPAKFTTGGGVYKRSAVETDNTIPYYDLENIKYTAKQIADVAAANFASAIAADSLSKDNITAIAEVLNSAEADVKLPSTIPFPEVRKQLSNMCRQRVQAHLGALDYFNTMVLHPGAFGKMELDLTINSYGKAFTDLNATFVDATNRWRKTTNFSKFKLKNIVLHLVKYELKPDTKATIGKQLLEKGFSIPYSDFRRNAVSWPATQSECNIEFRDPKVRSLDKIIIIPRFEFNVRDEAQANKYVFTPGCTPDSDGSAGRPWDGISEVELTYLNNKWPVRPIQIAPYKFDHIKTYAQRCFEAPFSIHQPALYRWQYEGLASVRDIMKVQYSDAEAKAPDDGHIIEVDKFDLDPYHAKFCAPCASDFAIMLDMRTMSAAVGSGVDLTKGTITINLKRGSSGATTPSNLKLDIYYVLSAFMRFSDNKVETVY